jgi:hypothetical protein
LHKPLSTTSQYGQDVLPEHLQVMQEIAAYLDTALKEKIEFNNLITRMTAFASVYHFAFGSKEDREVAIAQWAKALSDYPEWAIKEVLESTIQSYKASDEPLTPAMIIEQIRKSLRYYYATQRDLNYTIEKSVIHKSRDEYLAHKKAESERLMAQAKQKRKEEDERKASIARAANQFEDLRKENEEAAAKKIAEWEAQLQAERKEQAESMKNTMQKFKDNKRLIELYDEFEQLRQTLEVK